MARLLPSIVCAMQLFACDGLFSGEPEPGATFDGHIDGLNAAQVRTFLAGDAAFADHFSAERGLGPIFNQPACVSCHPKDGRGHPSTNLTRFGRGDSRSAARFDYLLALGGPQLQDRAVVGYQAEQLPAEATVRSVRGGPHVAGLGLIEAIPEAQILARADPDDRDGDGIRGVPNYVTPPSYFEPVGEHTPRDGKVLARFGRKATAISLLQQAASAYLADMGITSELEPRDLYNPLLGAFSGDTAADPEVSTDVLRSVVFYLQTLKPPPRRHTQSEAVQRGEALFARVGCAACHTPSMKTGASSIAALAYRDVPLYSDLLLHDMGPELADHYPEGLATGRQWRTTPLWGLGMVPLALGGQGYYLHDGRARSIAEAVALHGGEAQAARDRALALPAEDRDALLAFLESL